MATEQTSLLLLNAATHEPSVQHHITVSHDNTSKLANFDEVCSHELRTISKNEYANDTVGVCLSGGGMRSTAFHLGVMRALRKVDMLKDIDYLSSVSGGSQVASAYMTFLANYKDDYNEAADQLKHRMRKRYAYLAGGTISTAHFAASVVIGTLHNLLLLVSLAILGSSFVYAGYRSVTNSSDSLQSANTTDITKAVADIHYNLFYYLFYITGFYQMELDIAAGQYRSSILQYGWVWAGLGAVSLVFVAVAILLICTVHYNIFESKIENKGYHRMIAIGIQIMFFVCALVIIPILAIELLKVAIFGLGYVTHTLLTNL
jgi:uncharacterized membrane protein YidH (DUF202 family)